MRVLMLGWELPPHNSGGLGVACYQLCKALSMHSTIDIEFVLPYQERHEARFMTVTAARDQTAQALRMSGSAYDSNRYTVQTDALDSASVYTQQQAYAKAVAKLVETREFDVIHAHDWLTFRAALRAKQAKNVPLILHVHSIERDRAGGQTGNPFVREIEATSMLLADSVIAVSQLTKDSIVKDYAIPPKKITVIHNSIDHESLAGLDTDNAYRYLSKMHDQGYRIVASVGRLTVQKGLISMLEAAKIVIDKAPKTIFLIIGSGEQYFELVSKAAELGIARNVIFGGFQRGKTWRDAFAIADLFVMPSISEPFGLTPLESVGFGTPALVSKQSGVAEVLNNCLKVNFWDIQELANQITSVVRHDALRDELQRGAGRELNSINWNGAAEKLHRLYDTHLAGVTL